MSTAAMQAAGQHIPTSTYSSPPSSRQYNAHQPGHDESYYTQSSNPVSPPPQAARQHRRAATTQGTSPRNNYPGQSDEYAHPIATVHDAVTAGSSHGRSHSSVVDTYDGAPVPPPRSSSQNPNSPHATSITSKYARHHAEKAAGQNAHLARTYDDDTATRSRRRGPASPEGPQRASHTKERNEQAAVHPQSRSDAATSHPAPAPLIRENSEVINRIVVSDPQVDLERMQERVAEAQPQPTGGDLSRTTTNADEEPARGPQRRQDYSKSSSRRKDVQFGDYVLGQTLGEGEFGKVKLGWKKDGSTQVAIKLIRRESVATNPTRLPKIYREISILRDLAHPNIVRLHEMVETERHIGIILEYASGGELFDYILNQRYLKDPQARRLFAQLVSGVGYLHKKGIVHRDLKLENLLLDQNRNIIITDFGFANTFNPIDELSPEIEYNLGSKEFVRKYKLDRLDANGMRKGDLMQTSCGSPCYAAPELVVSDSLYTGRKVDVWSCGVILYAMLAGYLPFDDDPANPEGDNINLLYKYITSTPLTFPEYVSPHARDLLRRILVPDPRKRADLFEVARHSWLNEYHHVVAHITSSTTNVADIANATVPSELTEEYQQLARSASVRAPKSTSPKPPAGYARAETTSTDDSSRRDRNNRHTLQPEYVAPRTETARVAPGETAPRRPEATTMSAVQVSKNLPPDPPVSPGLARSQQPTTAAAAAVRPGRDVPRSVSDNTAVYTTGAGSQPVTQYATRPSTQGSLTSGHGPGKLDGRLPSRGSYGQPVAPALAATTVQGRVTQPNRASRGYNISGPAPQHAPQAAIGQAVSPPMAPPAVPEQRGHHRRSSTLSNLGERLFGRSGSVSKKEEARQKANKKYPPTAMRDPYPSGEAPPRLSTESKRSFSFGVKKRESSEMNVAEEKPRRFSLIPTSMSLRGLLGSSSRDPLNDGQPPSLQSSQQSTRPPTGHTYTATSNDGQTDRRYNNFSRPPPTQYRHGYQASTGDVYGGTGVYRPETTQAGASPSVSSHPVHQRQESRQVASQYPEEFAESRTSMQQSRPSKNVLTKSNRRFTDAYDNQSGGSSGASSGAVKKVQDFFRRRGRARADSEYR